MGGSEPKYQICVRHDDPLDKLLKHLASLEQPNDFHFSKHPHQTWKVVQFCWLHGSNEHCDTKLLATEMMNHSQFRTLRDKGASLMLAWDFIAISPHEQINWRDRVYAMHVQVQEQHRNAALEVLLKIYDSKAKTQFPLHRKHKIFPNVGENAMSVSGKHARTQAAATSAQKQLKQTMKTCVWEQAIANIDSPMIAGGGLFVVPSFLLHASRRQCEPVLQRGQTT